MIGGAPVDLAAVDPGEQHRRGLAELVVVCGEKAWDTGEGEVMWNGPRWVRTRHFFTVSGLVSDVAS